VACDGSAQSSLVHSPSIDGGRYGTIEEDPGFADLVPVMAASEPAGMGDDVFGETVVEGTQTGKRGGRPTQAPTGGGFETAGQSSDSNWIYTRTRGFVNKREFQAICDKNKDCTATGSGMAFGVSNRNNRPSRDEIAATIMAAEKEAKTQARTAADEACDAMKCYCKITAYQRKVSRHQIFSRSEYQAFMAVGGLGGSQVFPPEVEELLKKERPNWLIIAWAEYKAIGKSCLKR
jgi:hypothetical protein